MDIRGVGSGAASVEYVVRGAYLERNVVLHEYVHLFHGAVFSDQENRRVRQLYYQAMKENRTLDYYSANNESEYLAQTYPAYFEPVKVHPSDHKSINTTQMLREKDPAMYAFLDSLVEKQRAYLDGNRQAMADNWAEVYVRLSEEIRRKGTDDRKWALSAAYLDTALIWKPDYLPAYVSYAALKRQANKYEEAGEWLRKAKNTDSSYALIYTEAVELSNALFDEGLLLAESTIKQQASLFDRALALENDYAIRAEINRRAREFYANYALIPQAIQVAETYVKTAPVVSTYLRDRRDEALSFACYLRGTTAYREAPLAGYAPLTELSRMVSQKPQDYELRTQYAEVLAANGRYKEAMHTLSEAQRILSAAGTPRHDYALMVAEYAMALGDTALAHQTMIPYQDHKAFSASNLMRWVRIQAEMGNVSQAGTVMASLSLPKGTWLISDYHYTWGIVQRYRGELLVARQSFEAALKANPYHATARNNLIRLLEKMGNLQEAKAWQEGVRQLF
jgi:Flp pilus assembly protein TadD